MSAMRLVPPGRRGPVTVAMVGAGDTGQVLADAVLASPSAELVAISDRSMAALTHVAPFHPGTRLVRDYSQILEDPAIEAVIVATPAAARFPIALSALAAGKHVLVHGAPAADADQTQQLGDLAQRLGLTVMAGATYGYTAAAEAIGEMIAAGRLGALRFASTSVAVAGADPLDLATAELTLLTGWLGDAPRVVNAAAGAVDDQGRLGAVFVTLEFPGGAIAHVEAARLDTASRRLSTVTGAQATATIDAGGTLRVLHPDGGAVTPPLVQVDPRGSQVREFLAVLVGTRESSDSLDRAGVVAALTDEVGRLLGCC
jgi:predicted dehydrogenase